MFGQRGVDFVFRTRLAVRDWRLRTPAVAIPNAFPHAGIAVLLEGGLTRQGWIAAVRSPLSDLRVAVPFSVALGWSFFLPFDHPIDESDWWISGLWLAAMAAPATYWGAMVRRSGAGSGLQDLRWSAAASATLLVGLALTTVAAGFTWPAASEWIGVAAGNALGVAAAALTLTFADRRHPALPLGREG